MRVTASVNRWGEALRCDPASWGGALSQWSPVCLTRDDPHRVASRVEASSDAPLHPPLLSGSLQPCSLPSSPWGPRPRSGWMWDVRSPHDHHGLSCGLAGAVRRVSSACTVYRAAADIVHHAGRVDTVHRVDPPSHDLVTAVSVVDVDVGGSN